MKYHKYCKYSIGRPSLHRFLHCIYINWTLAHPIGNGSTKWRAKEGSFAILLCKIQITFIQHKAGHEGWLQSWIVDLCKRGKEHWMANVNEFNKILMNYWRKYLLFILSHTKYINAPLIEQLQNLPAEELTSEDNDDRVGQRIVYEGVGLQKDTTRILCIVLKSVTNAPHASLIYRRPPLLLTLRNILGFLFLLTTIIAPPPHLWIMNGVKIGVKTKNTIAL